MAADALPALTLPDGSRHCVYIWPVQSPRGIVQIAHGMAEHAGRYVRFAEALNAAGYTVYAQDLPAHGRTAGGEALGHLDGAAPFTQLLVALNGVRAHIEQRHPGLPLFLFGHSMGSFVTQHHLVEHGQGLAGAVLSGTSGTLGPLRAVGVQLNRWQVRLFGPRHRSALTRKLSFDAFNGQFKPNRTGSDWLSRDAVEVDAYVADPLCGFQCSANFWQGFLKAGARLLDATRLRRIPAALPVLMIAGGRDPVCQGGRGTHLLAEHYRRAGLGDVTVMVYEDARHELLNELPECRAVVTADVLEWLDAHQPV